MTPDYIRCVVAITFHQTEPSEPSLPSDLQEDVLRHGWYVAISYGNNFCVVALSRKVTKTNLDPNFRLNHTHAHVGGKAIVVGTHSL